MNEYMSGSELRQYLHISTRKMKYLMDNDYIPHENTGQATHKYRIRRADATAFKRRMDSEQGFLAELTGLFSNRAGQKHAPLLKVTADNRAAFHTWLTEQWRDLPDALPVNEIVCLIGGKPIQIHRLIASGTLHGAAVSGKVYCPKSEIIDYAASPEKLSHPNTQTYRELIRSFKKQQSCKRENEMRGCRRKSEQK